MNWRLLIPWLTTLLVVAAPLPGMWWAISTGRDVTRLGATELRVAGVPYSEGR